MLWPLPSSVLSPTSILCTTHYHTSKPLNAMLYLAPGPLHMLLPSLEYSSSLQCSIWLPPIPVVLSQGR